MTRLVDWRELGADRIVPLYAEQAAVWSGSLGWDLTRSWAVVERARAAGALPGLVSVNDRGAILGWTFFMRHQEVVQIGALAGRGAGPVRDLLEGILNAPESAGARELTCLLYPASPTALSALTRRRFELQPLYYFSRAVATEEDAPAVLPAELSLRRWMPADTVPCVRVLAAAYGRHRAGRGLAPNGTLEEWAYYLGQVLHSPACGQHLPRASFVVEERSTGMAVGCLLATTIGPDTVHVAQLAVVPQWGRRGVGRALLRAGARAASLERAARVTLLVSAENGDALKLYAGEGFAQTGQFTFASRPMPVRRQVGRRPPPAATTAAA